MKYMLILQFPPTLFTYDELIEFENTLISELKGIAEVDGHDLGTGEVNFFILSDTVNVAFDKIKALLKSEEVNVLKAAFREIDGEHYHILHPPQLTDFHVS